MEVTVLVVSNAQQENTPQAGLKPVELASQANFPLKGPRPVVHVQLALFQPKEHQHVLHVQPVNIPLEMLAFVRLVLLANSHHLQGELLPELAKLALRANHQALARHNVLLVGQAIMRLPTRQPVRNAPQDSGLQEERALVMTVTLGNTQQKGLHHV